MITVRQVQDAVCDHFGVTRDQMLEPNRARKFVRPRQIAMILARELTSESLPEIGALFYRDHTTILHAWWSKGKIEDDPRWGADIGLVRNRLVDPSAFARQQYEAHMRRVWKASVPYHLTEDWRKSHDRDMFSAEWEGVA